LIRGTKEISEGDVIPRHHLHQIPVQTGLLIAFLALYRCIVGPLRIQFENNSGTDMLEQYSEGWNTDIIDGFFPFSSSCLSIALQKTRVQFLSPQLVGPRKSGLILFKTLQHR
jgi:hypothetical protein